MLRFKKAGISSAYICGMESRASYLFREGINLVNNPLDIEVNLAFGYTRDGIKRAIRTFAFAKRNMYI